MRNRHPVGLYILFFSEMWERFGFYCMEAVFVYYMQASRYEFLRENASLIYGLYLAGVYFTPFFGGILAEWRWGYPLSIITGAMAMAAGYGFLALEPAVCFAGGLLCIIVGNGLFKPNISALVGKLYPPGDTRVDAALTIFYMGINIGALISPIAAAITVNLIGGRAGYLAAFGVASVGMLIGLVIFLLFRHLVIEAGQQSNTPSHAGTMRSLQQAVPADLQRRRYYALSIFYAINILFWMAFKQKGNALATWARDRTDLTAPEWLANALATVGLDGALVKDGLIGKEVFASLNPFFVIVFSPLLVWFWNALRGIRLDVPTPAKLVLGFALTAGSFGIMWQVAAQTTSGELVTPWALIACYAVLTLGELCLSPMGLSLVSKLAPSRTRAVWMGLFFVSTSIGGYLAGGVRQYIKDWPYANFFLLLTGSSVVAMILMLAAYPLIAAALRPAPAPAEPPAGPKDETRAPS
jgi:POT family proton-dependent oligopeptide transporter